MMYRVDPPASRRARKLYADKLVAEGVLTEADARAMVEQLSRGLDEGTPQARASLGMIGNKYTVDWSDTAQIDWTEPRAIRRRPRAAAARSAERTDDVPDGLSRCIRASRRSCANRKKMIAGELPLDWGCAETLAYARCSRMASPCASSGQDSGRGTFFHRHAVLHDQNSGATYMPLQHIARAPAARSRSSIRVLSEEAVHGLRVRLLDHRARLRW